MLVSMSSQSMGFPLAGFDVGRQPWQTGSVRCQVEQTDWAFAARRHLHTLWQQVLCRLLQFGFATDNGISKQQSRKHFGNRADFVDGVIVGSSSLHADATEMSRRYFAVLRTPIEKPTTCSALTYGLASRSILP